jgi:hypothetical protein
MPEDEVVRVRWTLQASQCKEQRQAITDAGGAIEDEKVFKPPPDELDKYAHARFEPLMILTAVFSLAFLAERVVKVIKDYKHGGLVIDLTQEPWTMREEPALDRGEVYLVKPGAVERVAKAEVLDIVAAIKAARGK